MSIEKAIQEHNERILCISNNMTPYDSNKILLLALKEAVLETLPKKKEIASNKNYPCGLCQVHLAQNNLIDQTTTNIEELFGGDNGDN